MGPYTQSEHDAAAGVGAIALIAIIAVLGAVLWAIG